MATFVLTAASENRPGTAGEDIYDGHDAGVTGGIDTLNAGAGHDQLLLDGGSGGFIVGNTGSDTVRLFGSDLGTTNFATVETLDAVGGAFSARISQLSAFGQLTNSASALAALDIALIGTGGVIDFSSRVTGNRSLDIDAAGLSSAATVSGTANGDILRGTVFADRLNGRGGNDTLDGRAGADTLSGGLGNDSYVVDAAGDVVNEIAGEGTADTIITSLGNYTLAAGLDIEVLRSSGANGGTLTGNAIAQTIIGNAASNTLDGMGGADTMRGWNGDDVYRIDDAGDVIIEVGNGGSDRLYTSVSYRLAKTAQVEVLSTNDQSGTAAINLVGNGTDQAIIGNNGDNLLNGGIGVDTLQGLLGNDTYIVDGFGNDVVRENAGGGVDTVAARRSYVLQAGAEIERLQTINPNATTFIDLTGNDLAQTLTGNNGSNVLSGMGGADTMRGLSGNDTYVVDDLGDVVNEVTGGGNQDKLVTTLINYTLQAGLSIEILVSGTGENGNYTGNEFAQTIIGNFAANTLDGRGGADTLQGLGGDDVYLIDDAGDVVVEDLSQGNDSVVAGVSYRLSATAEVEVMRTADQAGVQAINLTGNAVSQTMVGNNGDNRLDGGIGADTLQGLLGNDTYIVDGIGDVVIEAGGQGSDTISASGSFALSAGSEIERLKTVNSDATTAIDLTGNDLAQYILGNKGENDLNGRGGADTMRGLGGNDTYIVDTLADVVHEAAGEGSFDQVITTLAAYTIAAGLEIEGLAADSGNHAVQFTGNEHGQSLAGTQYGDVLDGSGGDDTLSGNDADTLIGGAGDDTYLFTGFGVSSVAHIVENSGEGDDIVIGSGGFLTLATGAEVERIKGSGRIVGNELAQTIVGSSSRDLIFGGGGADTMQGGSEIDAYVIEDASAIVIDSGQNTVLARVSYALLPDSTITDLQVANGISGAIDLTGSNVRQRLQGNSANNVLDGRGGADSMSGFGGDDTYYIDNVKDRVSDSSGIDTVLTSISFVLLFSLERLLVADSGTTTAINLTGNSSLNSIVGNAGDNRLDGAGASDSLQGLLGEDTFAFTSSFAPENIDTILDFSAADDTIELSSSVVPDLPAGELAPSAFRTNATGQAQNPLERIIYNTTTGDLFYDSDGNGAEAAIKFAILSTGLALTNADFIVV